MDRKQNTRRPNVLLVLTDDQGWGDLGCKGNTNIHTPNLDRLAAQGADFQWFYVTPLCAPTRAQILTGRYFPRTGVRGVTRRAECLNLDETTLGDVFLAAGYRTGYFGKWHSGSVYPYHPNGRGFEEFTGFCCGHWSHYFDSTLEHNGEEFQAEGYITDVFTDRAIDFIERHQDEPFLCYLAFNVPHSPFQVPDEWYDRVRDREITLRHHDPEKEDIAVTRAVLAMCENMDWNVGRVLGRIDDLGLAEDTIVVFLTDNGPNSWRWNGGMRGRKGSVDEGGVRTACFMRWENHIAPGLVIDRIAGDIDLLPTLADLAGIPRQVAKPLDGCSLKPLLLGEIALEEWPERMIFSRSPNGKQASVRTQTHRAGGHLGGLYNLDTDIGQHHNLAGEQPELHQKLVGALATWQAEMNTLYDDGDTGRPLPVGHAEFPRTDLAAQDGVPEGEITWSSIHPNASFFTNWHRAEDSISWGIDVECAGLYEVTLLYACSSAGVGSTLRVEFMGQHLEGTVNQPFDPPLKDRDDRVKRTESYEKPFRPLVLGKIHLSRGMGKLRLSVVEMPGPVVIDLRALRLRLCSTEA